MRKATLSRKTKETDITVTVHIDGSGIATVSTGIGFLDHMIELLAKHGLFDIRVQCKGDLLVDDHHTTEDVAIVLAKAFDKALGTKDGIARYGHAYVPMDESLARCVVDLSGRAALYFDAEFARKKVGDLSTEMIGHFFQSFADNLKANIHVEVLHGTNTHHKIEAMFKALGRSLRQAAERDPRAKGIPSTKGVL
ncbi:MAG: imidazoleglycerol-phosphate dehydratase HisB [Ignavibacteriales bacterium]|nr:imidazoleglycerol-phosphate dehydratase HisB [Ignavibacteriales bacterium]